MGLMYIIFANVAVAQAYVVPNGERPHDVSTHSTPVSARKPWKTDEIFEKPQPVSWNPLVFGMILGLFASAIVGQKPALANDLGNGESVFQANCASCHANGNNSVAPEKKLTKDALQKYNKYEPGAVSTMIAKGGGPMPAFGGKLSPNDIADTAAYV